MLTKSEGNNRHRNRSVHVVPYDKYLDSERRSSMARTEVEDQEDVGMDVDN